MEPPVDPQAARRLRAIARLAFGWALILLLRLVYLQVYSHHDLKRIAQSQHERVAEIPAPRGMLFDRNGRPLAMSVQMDSVCVNPLRIPDPGVASGILAGVLDLDEPELRRRIQAAKEAGRGFMWVARKIPAAEADRLRTLRLDWVEFRKETHRHYPKGALAAHVVGGVDYEEKGNAGIELGLNEDLEGIPGAVRLLKDVKERGFESHVEASPLPGKNVTLTVDERIQYAVEQSLARAVRGSGSKTGSVVVLDARANEVLAMASYPTFNPNEPVRSRRDLSSRLNLAVSGPFEPGSVFKVVTLSSALETTRLRPESMINCGNGAFSLYGRVIREAKHGYGYLQLQQVLWKSSNIGAIQIALQMGEARFFEHMRQFGFGRVTGLPLPAEEPGKLRELRNWGKTSIGSLAMGHEISTTTIQLAQACSVVANGGLLIPPRLVLAKQRPGGPLEAAPAPAPKRVLRAVTAQTMRRIMEGVVLTGGTGTRARIPGYTCGGKTGSAQIFDFETHKYTHKYNASFIGFAPLNNPAVVVAVTINGASEFGGVVAAPVFSEVAAAALRILDVPKDLPDQEPEGSQDARADADEDDLAIASLGDGLGESPSAAATPVPGEPSVPLTPAVAVTGPRVPDFRGKTMRAVLAEASASGLPVVVEGRGLARAQRPEAGLPLPPGESIRVLFSR